MSVSANCSSCRKPFKWYRKAYRCHCGEFFCANCLKSLPSIPWYDDNPFASLSINPAKGFWISDSLCSSCWEQHAKSIAQDIENRKASASSNSSFVEVFPSTYKGKIPKASESEERLIKTRYFRNRDDAEKQLCYIAAYFGYNLIYDRKWHKQTSSETSEGGKGTYYYSTWAATGVASNRMMNDIMKSFLATIKISGF